MTLNYAQARITGAIINTGGQTAPGAINLAQHIDEARTIWGISIDDTCQWIEHQAASTWPVNVESFQQWAESQAQK